MSERKLKVRRIIEDRVVKIDGDLIVVKNSINDVYRCRLTSGVNLIVKARLLRKDIVEREKKIMELVRFVSKSVKTCKYFGPGIIETKDRITNVLSLLKQTHCMSVFWKKWRVDTLNLKIF